MVAAADFDSSASEAGCEVFERPHEDATLAAAQTQELHIRLVHREQGFDVVEPFPLQHVLEPFQVVLLEEAPEIERHAECLHRCAVPAHRHVQH